MFSFGIVLCEVGPGAGGSRLQPCPHLLRSCRLEACWGPRPGRLWGPAAHHCLHPRGQMGARPGVTHPQTRLGGTQPQGPAGNCRASSGQIIGRVNADPDYLPRTMDFGLNVRGFLDRYCPPTGPPSFFPITVRCCDLDPEKR